MTEHDVSATSPDAHRARRARIVRPAGPSARSSDLSPLRTVRRHAVAADASRPRPPSGGPSGLDNENSSLANVCPPPEPFISIPPGRNKKSPFAASGGIHITSIDSHLGKQCDGKSVPFRAETFGVVQSGVTADEVIGR